MPMPTQGAWARAFSPDVLQKAFGQYRNVYAPAVGVEADQGDEALMLDPRFESWMKGGMQAAPGKNPVENVGGGAGGASGSGAPLNMPSKEAASLSSLQAGAGMGSSAGWMQSPHMPTGKAIRPPQMQPTGGMGNLKGVY